MEKTILETYIEQIKHYPLLSADEEIDLARRVANGDKAAEQTLVHSNLRLVVSVAKKFNGNNISTMDLIQEGNMGLMTAAAKFREEFKTRFSTYAYLWISQAMLRFVRNKQLLISIPYRKETLIRKVSRAKEVLRSKYDREPLIEEIAHYLSVLPEDISDAMSCAYSVSSLDCPVTEEANATVGDLMSDTKPTPEEECLAEESRKEVIQLLNELPLVERKVLYHRYNLVRDEKSKTLRQIGDMLGVSSETVRQMEMRAIRKLRAVV